MKLQENRLYLSRACEIGNKELVKILLDAGADGRIHSVTKYSPLYIACYSGHKDIVTLLLKVPLIWLYWNFQMKLLINCRFSG